MLTSSCVATPDVIHQAKFALEIKRDCLPIYEKAFDVEFPLPKLDTLVAADFDAGAMENWGLITGRTTAFLYDDAVSGLVAKKRVATVQSHEVLCLPYLARSTHSLHFCS